MHNSKQEILARSGNWLKIIAREEKSSFFFYQKKKNCLATTKKRTTIANALLILWREPNIKKKEREECKHFAYQGPSSLSLSFLFPSLFKSARKQKLYSFFFSFSRARIILVRHGCVAKTQQSQFCEKCYTE